MAPNEDELPDLAQSAGFLTLSAQLSRESVDRIVSILRKELAAGRALGQLGKELQKNLPDYDEHSRTVLLQLGANVRVPDDFPPENVDSCAEVKANTLELKLKRAPEGITLFSLVCHKDRLWLVTEFEGTRCVLKHV